MAVQFQSKEPMPIRGGGEEPTGLSREAQEQLTMQKRIEAFYRQSGGPNNPDIPKILEKHLLYGRDHGPKGKRETLEDALRDMIAQDYSNQILFKWFMQWRMERQKQAQADRAELARIRGEIESLKQQVEALRALMEEHIVAQQAVSHRAEEGKPWS
ncbi:hypothetical protein [Alicyclobacillus sendaiensis]|uniref:Uncharacterized protein n=1 Tax=Alicyclobacillus sendaiensis PA2 TaxID=3029425 RepID=A0ABT6XZ69_ALISE|nr:hypothetical protein [Alicyclobacillus sendaiensis]MDI9260376.1 hypothetical protein [Alicyclobacillus sendaiensis PA2]